MIAQAHLLHRIGQVRFGSYAYEKKVAQAAPASLPKQTPEPDATPSLRKRPGSDPGQGL